MLKVGVFGVGHLGKFHLNNWKQIPTVELVGFYDPNNEAAEKNVDKKIPFYLRIQLSCIRAYYSIIEDFP